MPRFRYRHWLWIILGCGVGVLVMAPQLRHKRPAAPQTLTERLADVAEDIASQVRQRQRAAPQTLAERLAYAAEDIVDPHVAYDPAYVQIGYPGGDVPALRGVCSDVIIRAYRKLDIDLQVLVHEDMRRHFSAYPNNWGLRRPDRNIDHRRVFNLAAFFQRHGETLPCTTHSDDYRPGDIVVWQVQQQAHRHRRQPAQPGQEPVSHRAQYRCRAGAGGYALRLSHHRTLPLCRRKISRPPAMPIPDPES